MVEGMDYSFSETGLGTLLLKAQQASKWQRDGFSDIERDLCSQTIEILCRHCCGKAAASDSWRLQPFCNSCQIVFRAEARACMRNYPSSFLLAWQRRAILQIVMHEKDVKTKVLLPVVTMLRNTYYSVLGHLHMSLWMACLYRLSSTFLCHFS